MTKFSFQQKALPCQNWMPLFGPPCRFKVLIGPVLLLQDTDFHGFL